MLVEETMFLEYENKETNGYGPKCIPRDMLKKKGRGQSHNKHRGITETCSGEKHSLEVSQLLSVYFMWFTYKVTKAAASVFGAVILTFLSPSLTREAPAKRTGSYFAKPFG